MQDNRLSIIIAATADKAFNFSLNSTNTPRWISSVISEVNDGDPPKLGTKYTNLNINNDESEYVITHFDKGKSFTMSQIGSDYRVRYTFRSLPNNQTEFEYYEWVESGELEHPFSQVELDNFKRIIERKYTYPQRNH